MSATHTPGPWKAMGCAVYAPDIKRCFGGPIRDYIQPVAISEAEDSEESFDDSVWPKVRTPGFDEAEANARLIAAAPTMYDYLTFLASSGDNKAHEILSKIT